MNMKRLGTPAGNTVPSGDMRGLETTLLRHQTTASTIILDRWANDAEPF